MQALESLFPRNDFTLLASIVLLAAARRRS